MKLSEAAIVSLLFCWVVVIVKGHGRLMDPPARNSMWRFGYPNPVNYNDNQLNCGGAGAQWTQNAGKCGICGDDWNESPKPHEAGGKFARGIISRRYSAGQVIKITVNLTTNHKGHFELNLCPVLNPMQEVTAECLALHPLKLADSEEERFVLTDEHPRSAVVHYSVQLPQFITCTQCVLRWKYVTGNNWGNCTDGTEGNGCGPQEHFINCADVTILSSAAGPIPPGFVDNPHAYFLRQHGSNDLTPLVVTSDACVATGIYSAVEGMHEYCKIHCLRYPPYCPPDKCKCYTRCWAIGSLSGKPGADEYCMDQCLVSNSHKTCPPQRCQCE